jgi:6-phosphogluconolactonase
LESTAELDRSRRVKIEIYSDDNTVAREAAAVIAEDMRTAVAARERYIMAVSGGRTPWLMLRALAAEPLPWQQVHVVQVDERVAPADDPERNLAHLRASLLTRVPLPPDHIHAMPVEATDLGRAAAQYAATLQDVAGSPPLLDLVHLGLGPDGHTASLVPGDPALDVTAADVAVTGPYQGRRRMTLTFPIINRSRFVLWLVTGAEKAATLVRLRDGDRSIPAARVREEPALLLADRAAAELLGSNEEQETEK